jgi:hypothetical protein
LIDGNADATGCTTFCEFGSESFNFRSIDHIAPAAEPVWPLGIRGGSIC